jgi:peptidoglycan/xylan/chitin deacetylase (PgdA/CDA1 family)
MRPTEVCITFDTEFTIGGAFADPERSPIGAPHVWGPVGDRQEGLGFILDSLKRHGLKGVFFVEALNRSFFGDEPMRTVCRRILEEGHDVQLHTHPCWLAFDNPDWKGAVAGTRPRDHFVGRPRTETAEIIRRGLDTLCDWGAPRPISLRTGNLQADVETYRAMRDAGLPLASNLGWALFAPPEPELKLFGGRHRIEGVLSFETRFGPRLYTITANSFAALRSILRQARRAAVETVVLLTHPSEFFKHDGNGRYRRNRVNQRRFDRLCAFLAARPADFDIVTFTGAAQRWLEADEVAAPDLRGSAWDTLVSKASNAVNDRFWLY